MEQENVELLGKIDDYWKMIPTHHTPSYSVDKEISDLETVKVLTLSKHHQNWKLILDCPNLEEINLDQPNPDQVQAMSELIGLKRLRIKNLRTNTISFLENLVNVEELALEYVSGFSDLSPLHHLSKLKALHLENLRKVSNFDGLRGIESLKYLHIDGTLDWKQPIENFMFLEELSELEVISLMGIANKASFPAFLSVLKLKKLLEIRIPRETLNTAEYAFLEVAKPYAIKGFENMTSWPLYVNKDYNDQGYVSLLGKGEGRVKLSRPDATEKLAAYTKKYEEYKQKSQEIILSQ
ncbi:leucine-rich repeat domain-containing protein [Chryseobacterium sp. G0186]|uniref:leucine-rich repeat domain-containing protein n=1 Tax=Chryseobacterium sp. G0186 TaxID=2487064 RepID=UPI000F4EE650|nr:leucine-rich repeat domain-containing protein [Chryseobacterium sp. G0186]AZA76358.1 leucine-rich repeat domain-containing protein [Chryseobacterium sp. G0186]